ncbi:MAG: pantoate--beta-alanine ligase [Deltaproteobacteria bacterium]|nr:pantoate--beta-alanine ligase [Deltaproteobacteria bacterium]
MRIIQNVKEMQNYAESLRKQGKRISFVPTMGYLHEGHVSLMKEAKRRGDQLIVSIYVNPVQFIAGEDFEKYPRDMARDEKIADAAGVDVIFSPAHAKMYPEQYQTYVTVEGVTRNLCGVSRPGHFRGVTTVCAKLFHIVKPHVAVFGKKDFQQLVAIRRMVDDLNMDIEIIGMPTARETDGLAMSSRNVYLKDGERESALSLSRSLVTARELYAQGERDADKILSRIRAYIEGHPYTRIDYAKICNTKTLEDVERLAGKEVLALAVMVGSTRLIDNYVFGEELTI